MVAVALMENGSAWRVPRGCEVTAERFRDVAASSTEMAVVSSDHHVNHALRLLAQPPSRTLLVYRSSNAVYAVARATRRSR
jgi:hypothetical protein